MMKLWILKPLVKNFECGDNPWSPWYNKVLGFVIRAETEDRARGIANENGGTETSGEFIRKDIGNPWLDKNYSSCIELPPDGEEEMIIRDFASA